jgi:hypothetical protein
MIYEIDFANTDLVLGGGFDATCVAGTIGGTGLSALAGAGGGVIIPAVGPVVGFVVGFVGGFLQSSAASGCYAPNPPKSQPKITVPVRPHR